MFQTLQPVDNRINKTAIPGHRRRLLIKQQMQQRPCTVGFQDITFQKQKIKNHFTTLDSAMLQVTNTFRKEMNPYIKLRIRSSLSQNSQRKNFFNNSLNKYKLQDTLNYQNPQGLQQSQNQPYFQSKNKIFFKLNKTINNFNQTIDSSCPINIKQMKLSAILNKQPLNSVKKQDFINQSIVANTKQKISRLIQMKKQKQFQYQKLKQSIKKKRQKNNKPMQKRIFLQKYKLPNMQEQEWDREWRQNLNKESNRYRNRLVLKHKRSLSTRVTQPLVIKQ